MNTRRSQRVEEAAPAYGIPPPDADTRDPRAVDLGNRIRAAREKQKLTQAELAQRFGGHVNTLSKWERGVSVPSALELLRLSRVLREPADLLLGSRPEPGKASFHQPPGVEGAALLDVSLLAETLAAVRDGLQARQIELPSHAFAELVSVIYEQEAAQRAKAPGSGDVAGTTTRVLRLVKGA